ncbi:MAG TPA: FkbM family methyltransferase [Rhodanobacteraceae bacterium]|nr:FkbM family methyltransferase [Rhodanobacteraceae bacterium]
MSILDTLKNSTWLRWPLLAFSRLLLRPLKAGPSLLRRAAYDALPVRYFVTGQREQFVVSTRDKVIGRELFLQGEFDFGKLQSALDILSREGLPLPRHLIDVGANVGSITIPALARGLVHDASAIEPHPENLRLLQANLALNGLAERVRVLGLAVGADTSSQLNLRESASNSGNHSIGAVGIAVPSARLDDLDLPHPDALLWMDIEGYEGHALHGAANLLASGLPVVCEFNPGFLCESGGLSWFQAALAGRRIFDLQDNTRTETTLDALASALDTHLAYTDILAIPAGQGRRV